MSKNRGDCARFLVTCGKIFLAIWEAAASSRQAMADIFLSYAREDLNFAEKLAKALETQGWSVWWDRRIPAGDRFNEVIAGQLKGARCAVTVWSRQSVASRWVHGEAEYALEQKKMVPVLADDVDIPLGFRGVQAADLRGWRGHLQHPGFRRLVRDISERLGAAPQQKSRKPKPSVSDWLRQIVSWLREAAPVAGAGILPIIKGIAKRSRVWVSGFTKRKIAIAVSVGVLVVLVAVIFYWYEPPNRQITNIPDIAAQITKCNSAKGVLTIYIEFVNNKKEAHEIALVHGRNYNQYSVAAGGERYFILLDDAKVPMATPLNSECASLTVQGCQELNVKIDGGGSYTFWAMYPAPPVDVKSIIFYTPFSRPFVDVPITDSR